MAVPTTAMLHEMANRLVTYETRLTQSEAQIQELARMLSVQHGERDLLQAEIDAGSIERDNLGIRIDALVTQLAERSQRAGSDSLVDTKLLTKPSKFSGNQADWTSWSFLFKAYIGAVDTILRQMLESIATVESVILQNTLTLQEQKLSSQLYYILILLSTDKALTKMMVCPEGNGAEAWRQFLVEWEPR